MKTLSNQKLPKDLGGFISLQENLNQAVTARSALMVGLSGYPFASHVAGKIQSYLDLTSMKTLLTSVLKLRDLSKLASDVLNTIPLARIDRAQLVRTELLAYITQNAGAYGYSALTEEDKELVAFLITSSESQESSWVLNFPATDSNRNIQLQHLYTTLLDPKPIGLDEDFKISGPSADAAVTYDGIGEIVPFSSTRKVKSLIDATRTAAQGIKNASARTRLINSAADDIRALRTVGALAHIRVIDHIWALLNDVDVWRQFITPRKSVDSGQNIERAKGLKLFSSYLHSLLMYDHVFSIELFRQTLDKIQGWLTSFSPLPAEVVARYDQIIRTHDVLGAHIDVKAVMDSLSTSGDLALGVDIIGLPAELSGVVGLKTIRLKGEAKASQIITPLNLPSLKDLDKPEYAYLMMSHPVDAFNMIKDIPTAIITSEITAHEIKEAAAAFVPGLSRFYSTEVVDRLNALSPKLPFPINGQIPCTQVVKETTSATVNGGTLRFRPLTARHTYDYQYHIRRDKTYEIFKASDILTGSDPYLPHMLINNDLAGKLRGIIQKEWKALMPASLCKGDTVYTADSLKVDKELVRHLFETLGGQHFDVIERTIGNEYTRRLWATFISSWGLMYIIPEEMDLPGASKESLASLSVYQVTGYGMPYGCTYTALADKQGAAKPGDFIQITKGVYVKMLTQIPKPTEQMTAHESFYLEHPYYYYPSNSGTIKVNKWVIADGLLHMATLPIYGTYHKLPVFMDKRYAYLNDYVLIQTDIAYALTGDADGGFTYTIPLSKREWPYDRFVYFADYITFGNYVTVPASLASAEPSEIKEMVQSMEKEITKIEEQAPANNPEKNSVKLIENVEITQIDQKTDSNKGGSKKDNSNSSKKEEPKEKKEEKKMDAPKSVAELTDPKTGETIEVIPKEGESKEDAIARVKAKHGIKD